MGLDKGIKKVVILGSGPIIIGQAAEFDYSGTQACISIREEGIETILVNSNPATIMTDLNIADKVYIEPLTVEFLEKILIEEKPDGLLAGFGGQTALNLAMKLDESGFLTAHGIRLLGVDSDSIRTAEDRELFRSKMNEIGEPVPDSIIATNIDQCLAFVDRIGYPVIIRPAYTLGGTGGGIAMSEAELLPLCNLGIRLSPIGQILLERSIAGWKELEYEVVRDGKDNCIIICNMENVDPVGIHTGDSIVVAPSQTLRDHEHQMLRNAAIRIIRSLKIQGGCNVQFALDPYSSEYMVIEVNPRVSRSSALASKAVGYPIAKIAAKIAVGYSLNELKNYVTEASSAFFEPTIDYVVVKIPKWPFEKFNTASTGLGTQMKATGEVMAIDRTFEAALLKAVKSLDSKFTLFSNDKLNELSDKELEQGITDQTSDRLAFIAEAFRRGIQVQQINEMTGIDKWFLEKLSWIIKIEMELGTAKEPTKEEAVLTAIKAGFAGDDIIKLAKIDRQILNQIKHEHDAETVYKIVDTCGGEFEAKTPYYYSCVERFDENVISKQKKIIVLGSGPIKIGQGVEFDYCCVHAAWAIRQEGYQSIIINNNPETVSTDFDIADKLYFESMDLEHVMNIIDCENPDGVMVQFGGQTSINLAEGLTKRGVKLIGTPFHAIDTAEDREQFIHMMDKLDIAVPKGCSVENALQAQEAAANIGFPVIIRPSYVIGGRAMQVVNNRAELQDYLEKTGFLEGKALLVDRYISGTEIEVDAVSDGTDILIPGIMEHVERAGVHSGDSISMYPSRTVPEHVLELLEQYSRKIAIELGVVGLFNIQYVYDTIEDKVYVIEVNPRASRTVPILSKITGVPMIELAVKVSIGQKLLDLGYGTGRMETEDKGYQENVLHAVKVPVFSNEKLANVDTCLGPEMRSTGEVLGMDTDFDKAVYKGFAAAGIQIPTEGRIYVSLNSNAEDKDFEIIQAYHNLGFSLSASKGTHELLRAREIQSERVEMSVLTDNLHNENIRLIINLPTTGNDPATEGFKIRRKAAESRVPLFTCMDSAEFFLRAVKVCKEQSQIEAKSLDSYFIKDEVNI